MDPIRTAKNYDELAGWWKDQHADTEYGAAQLKRAISFTKSCDHALDVGCGSSGRFIEILRSAGFTAEGVDNSPEMLRHAQEVHPDVTFHLGDISSWKPERSYDLISAWDSTFHLPLDRQEPALLNMCDALNPQGILIFTFGGSNEPGEISGSFEGQDFEYSTLGESRFLELLGKFGLHCRHLEYDQGSSEPHVYLIAQKP